MTTTIQHDPVRISTLARATTLVLLLLGVAATPARSDDGAGLRPLAREATAVGIPTALQHQPLAFEPNRGQSDPRVSFLARGADYSVFLTPTEAVLTLGGREHQSAVVRLKPVGASPTAHLVPDEPLGGVVNYARVPDTAPISVPTYAKVRYAEVYPGVDLVYYGHPHQVEYDFVVAPGADPGRIQLALDGADKLELDAQGELVLHTAAGLLRQPRPVAYQEIDGARRVVSADYRIADGRVGFRLGAYDRSHRLVIDPVLAFSTYLGGSNDEMDWLFGPAFGIAVDAAGNTYVTGSTTSVDFPTTPGMYRTLSGSQDVFVTKFSPTGAVLYSTYLGGPCDDIGNDIAVDAAGNAYVTGRAHGGVCWVEVDPGALVAKLGPTGDVIYTLVFGGGLVDTSAGKAIAVDAQGVAYVTGTTASPGFPTTPGAVRTAPCPTAIDPTYTDGFVARISAAGALVYSTFLCGDGYDEPHDIAVDTAGNAYVGGWTASGTFPTVNPLQATSHVYPFGMTGFVSKLAADGTHLIYSTYLGGSINDYLNGLALDGQGNVYVAGKTESSDFPTTAGVLQSRRGNLICIDQFCTDAFVAKINAAGSALVYSTYLYGEGDDGAAKIAVDAAGDAYVVGTTSSLFFPIRDAFQASSRVRGPSDAFVAKLSPDAKRLYYSSYLGGSGPFESPQTGEDDGSAIAIDAAGNASVTGFTRSYDFPTTAGAFQPNIGGGVCDFLGAPCGDAFVAKITAGGPGAASPTSVTVTPNATKPGGTVTTTWTGVPIPTPGDYLILYALGSGSETYVDYWTTGGAAAGTRALTLPANLAAGNYEIRLLSPDANYGGLLESVARSQPIHVGASSCGLGAELAAAMPLLSALRRRLRRRSNHPRRVVEGGIMARAAGFTTLIGVAICVAVPGVAGAYVQSFTLAHALLGGHGCPLVTLDDLAENGALGVTSADVNATSPFDCEEPYANFAWDGFALADVDLFQGELHAVAFASSPAREADGSVIGTTGQAIFSDTIELHGEGPGQVGISLAVDGTMESTGMGIFSLYACFGTSTGDIDPSTRAVCETRDNFDQGNTFVGVPTAPTDVEIHLGGAQPIASEINVYAELLVHAADGWNGGTAAMNFQHTAKLAVTVPEGYTFTSQSGMLLAPEPSATLQALAACGAGLVVLRRRRCS